MLCRAGTHCNLTSYLLILRWPDGRLSLARVFQSKGLATKTLVSQNLESPGDVDKCPR